MTTDEFCAAASSRSAERKLMWLTAPFRGYGIERIPGLRRCYGWLWEHVSAWFTGPVAVGGAILDVDPNDSSVVPQMRFLHTYEPALSRALDVLVRPGDCLIDVGAHVGYYTVRLAKRVGRHGRVVAYEPHEAQWRRLTDNVRRNEVGNQTVACQLAVGHARATSVVLWRDAKNSAGASLAPLAIVHPDGSEPVEVVSLDEDLPNRGTEATQPNLIKIDVQGYEARVIEGAWKTIRQAHPVLAFEYNPSQIAAAGDDAQRLLGRLAGEGYRLFFADDVQGVVVPVGVEAAHSVCLSEKPDGTGYINLIAIHVADRRFVTR